MRSMIQICTIAGLEHAKSFYYLNKDGFIVEKEFLEEEVPICTLPGFEGVAEYLYITNHGRVISRFSGEKILNPVEDRDGYLRIRLSSKNGKRYQAHVHRLVAMAFIPNEDPERLTTVDHINRNKKENNVSNLRWADHKMQSLNSSAVTRIKQFTEDKSMEILEWASMQSVIDAFGITRKDLNNALDKKIPIAGYYFERA